jgi:hypothetical protein
VIHLGRIVESISCPAAIEERNRLAREIHDTLIAPSLLPSASLKVTAACEIPPHFSIGLRKARKAALCPKANAGREVARF